MSVLELAKKYYPNLWNKDRIKTLVMMIPQKLTPDEYKEITGEDYTA